MLQVQGRTYTEISQARVAADVSVVLDSKCGARALPPKHASIQESRVWSLSSLLAASRTTPLPSSEELRQLTLGNTRPALVICILNEFILKSWGRPYTANGSTVAKRESASVKREEHGDHRGSAHRFSIYAVKYGTGASVPCPILSVDVEMSIPVCEKGEFEDSGNVLKGL